MPLPRESAEPSWPTGTRSLETPSRPVRFDGMAEETAIRGRNSGFTTVLAPILEQRFERILAQSDDPT